MLVMPMTLVSFVADYGKLHRNIFASPTVLQILVKQYLLQLCENVIWSVAGLAATPVQEIANLAIQW